MADQNGPLPVSPEALQVSWQTIFWTLVPLAINVMTQPSGRVLGTRPKYRAYLRALPIFCAFDAAQLVICLALSPIFSGIPIRKTLLQILKTRYGKSVKDVGGSEGVRQMILRWIFFIFGTLGPGVKMATMEGIPWTKAWGMIYLGSFVIFEIAILFCRRLINRGRSVTAGAQVDAPDEVPLQPIGGVSTTPVSEEDILERIPMQLTGLSRGLNRGLYRLSAFVHSLVLVWAVCDLWWLRFPSPPASNYASGFTELVIHLLYTSCVLVGYLSLIFSLGLVGNAVMGGEEASSKIGIACILCIEGLGCLFVTGGLHMDGTLLLDIALLIAVFGGPLIVFMLVRLLCYEFPSLRNMLLNDGEGNPHTQDDELFWILTLFLVSFLASIMWYRFRYDPAGTVNPAWTGIFG